MEYNYDEKQLRIQQQFYDDRGKWKWNDTWATMPRRPAGPGTPIL